MHRQRPAQRQFALVEQADVLLPRIDVLDVNAVGVAERGDAGAEHVGAVPQAVAVDEFALRPVLDQRVGAGHLIAGLAHLVEGVADPGPLGRPVGHAAAGERLVLADDAQLLREDRVERQFHLVDGDALRCQGQRLGDALLPVVPRFADHAGDQVDVDLVEAEVARPAVGAVDLLLQMRPAVVFENLRIEILDAQAEARDAQLAQRFQLVLLQRARLALERHFLGPVPRQRGLEPLHQAAQLVGAEVRGRAAAEVDVFEPPAADDGFWL